MRSRIKLGPRGMLVLLAVFGGLFVHAAVYGTPQPLVAQAEPAQTMTVAADAPTFHYFPLSTQFTGLEIFLLFLSLAVAVAALLYAWMLVKQVVGADQGTPKMQAIAAAVRDGA